MVVRKAHNLEVRVRFPTPQPRKKKKSGVEKLALFR